MFSLHLSERRGILLLMTMLTALAGWVVYEQWIYEPPVTDLEPIRQELQEWLSRKEQIHSSGPAPLPSDSLFHFDPNTASRADWSRLGLSERQIDGLFRYIERGAKFRVKKDLQKVYTISPGMYERLEPYITLPDSITYEPRYARRTEDRREAPSERTNDRSSGNDRREPPATVIALDVNLADSLELVTLPGIGPAFARGIVRYRESLGGFHSLDQLAEVFVLRDKPDAVERLKQILFIGHPHRRLDINTVTAEELAAHPYISFKIARGLVNYRAQHGPFHEVDAIKGSMLITDSIYVKIAPYLFTGP